MRVLVAPLRMRKDAVTLESTQKSFNRMLPGLQQISYAGQMDNFGFFSLELWRLKVDLIEVYKISNVTDNQNL